MFGSAPYWIKVSAILIDFYISFEKIVNNKCNGVLFSLSVELGLIPFSRKIITNSKLNFYTAICRLEPKLDAPKFKSALILIKCLVAFNLFSINE